MIIFYDKDTGKIEGMVEGRVHDQNHLRIWYGDMQQINRIIIPWVVTGTEKITTPEGAEVDIQVWEAEHEQKDLLKDIESGKDALDNYRIDLATQHLVPIEAI